MSKMKAILKAAAIFAMAIMMASCDGSIGLMIHTAKVFDGIMSFNHRNDVEDDTIRFVVNKQNQMLFLAEINGVTDTVIYDSGVNTFAILMYTPSTKSEGMKFYNISILGADKRSKVKATTMPVKISTAMLLSEGLGMAMLVPESPKCDNEFALSEHNIIGFGGLDLSPYAIDFSKNQMYCIRDRLLIDSTEFIPVKCKYSHNVMFVYPQINGVEYECVFDTGNGNGILIQDAQRVKNQVDTDMLMEGSFSITIGGATKKQHFVVDTDEIVGLAGHEEAFPVMYLEKGLSFNNVGLQFIKRFDWIIDSRYNPTTHKRSYRMYARPHAGDTVIFNKPHYAISTADGTLKILTRLIDGNEKFKVGDRIVSVNGEKITEENICHYYDLLTENKDWSEFEIQVK